MATWMMLQREKPDDYVIGTGESHTVREFCQQAFGVVGPGRQLAKGTCRSWKLDPVNPQDRSWPTAGEGGESQLGLPHLLVRQSTVDSKAASMLKILLCRPG